MNAREHSYALLSWLDRAGVDQFDFAVSRRASSGAFLPSRAPVSVAEVGKHLAWCGSQNIQRTDQPGADIYVRPARGACWPLVMLDDLTRSAAEQILNQYAALQVETSRNNYQVWIRTDKALSEFERLAVQKALIQHYGGDPGCVSGEHFGRLPGFRNHKPGRGGFWVSVRRVATNQKPLAVLDLSRHQDTESCPLAAGHAHSGSKGDAFGAGRYDPSLAEFGYCCKALKAGISLDRVRNGITAHASARRGADTARYVERTLQHACVEVGVGYCAP
ncbi:MAG: RepB family DNA primase [Sulfuricella denitrificans]|nr:RepB family DNA primase [Sulfuricella denitrificans]